MICRAQQIEPDVLLRKVMHRPVAGLLDAQGRTALGYRHIAKNDFDAPAFRHQIDAIIRAADKTWGGVGHFDILQR